MVGDRNRVRDLRTTFFGIAFFFSLPLSAAYRVWPEWAIVSGRRVDYYSPALYLSHLTATALFLTAVNRRSLLTFIRKHRSLIGAALVVTSLNVIFSILPVVSLYFSLQWLLVLVVIAAVRALVRVKGTRWTIVAFSLGLVMQLVIGLTQFGIGSSLGLWCDARNLPGFCADLFRLLGETRFNTLTPGIAQAPVLGAWRLRAYGTLPHPNVLAGFFSVALLMFVSQSWKRSQLNTVALLASFMGLGLLLTFSRTAWLAVGVVGIWIFIRSRRASITALVAGLVLLISLSVFKQRWLSLLDSDRLAWVERFYLLEVSWRLFLDNPLFGTGLGTFIAALPGAARDIRMSYLLEPVHNLISLLFAETGLAGAGLVAAIFVKFKYALNTDFFPLLIGLILISFSDHYLATTHQGRMLLAVALGIALQSYSNETFRSV